MKNLFFLFFSLLLLVSPVLAQTRDSASPPEQTSRQEKAPPASSPSFPGVGEVIPRSSAVVEAAPQAESLIASLEDTGDFKTELGSIREEKNALYSRIATLGNLEDWSSDRLLEIRGRLTDLKSSSQKLLDGLSSRLQQLDVVLRQWTDKADFWGNWEKSLTGPQLKATEDAFRQANDAIKKVLEKARTASEPLVALQEEVSSLQTHNQEIISQIDAALDNLRKATFKKTGPSFVNLNFYRQFNARLWTSVKSGVSEVQGVDWQFFQEQGWVLILQVFLALVVGGWILRHRRRQEETREWQFLLHHPWAAGIFVAISSLSLLYSHPPGLWRLTLWLLAAVSAAVLISGLLRNPRKIFMVNLLAALFILTLALQIISFPLPLYRLYLALVSLVGTPVLILLAISNQRVRGAEGKGFTFALKAGAAIFFISFLAQAGGYIALSSRIMESSLETVFLGLFAAMVVRLGQGGIDFLLDRDFFQTWRFFRRFGDELIYRLKKLFQIIVTIYTILYLLEIWKVFDSVGQAWSTILDFGLTLGQTRLTVKMVLFAVLVLYASIIVSWVIRSFLEAEVFPRRKFDRGVRDSIKKLLHYCFVLFGFLLAMSLAGVELKNFAVLAGALGIGIGFGLQNIVNNFVSGLILLFERPIKVGDMVVLDDEWGSVRKIGLRSTVITILDESEIIVPNSLLVSEKVTNWSLTSTLCRLSVPVGVAYGSDVALVLKILSEVGGQVAEIMADPPPSPLFKGFGDSSLDFELRVWISDVKNRMAVQSEICRYIDRRFRAEGVEIPFPQRDLHIRSAAEGLLGSPGGKGVEEA
jgi:potassium efflux system protein